jgi:hypothetical protein
VFFAWVQKKTSITSVSLDPADKESTHYIPSLYEHQVDEKDVKKNNNEQKNDEHNEK